MSRSARRAATSDRLSDHRLFDGYPYLVSRLAPEVYHLLLLPADLGDLALIELARAQARGTHLDTCLVLAATIAVYLDREGRGRLSLEPPRGGQVVAGPLRWQPSFAFTPELERRQRRLEREIRERAGRGLARGLSAPLFQDRPA